MNTGPELQAHAATEELVRNGASVRNRAGQAVELGHDQCVPCPDGGQRLVEAGTGPVHPRETMVGVDAIRRHA